MQYVQMTLSDWVEIKEKIRKDMNNVKHAFVRVGYNLRRIRDEELYKMDGYDSLTQFAAEELGIGASWVSRLISINERYSVDGYSETLLPQYEDYRQSSLVEMLALPETDMQMVTPETSREDIRELKRFNKAPEEGPDELDGVIEAMGRQDPELVRALRECFLAGEESIAKLAETVNPSGSRVFKKGLYFLSFTDKEVKVKKFGGTPTQISYTEYMRRMIRIFGEEQENREETGEKEEAYEGAEEQRGTVQVHDGADENHEGGDGESNAEGRSGRGVPDEGVETDRGSGTEDPVAGEGNSPLEGGPGQAVCGSGEKEEEKKVKPTETGIAPAQFSTPEEDKTRLEDQEKEGSPEKPEEEKPENQQAEDAPEDTPGRAAPEDTSGKAMLEDTAGRTALEDTSGRTAPEDTPGRSALENAHSPDTQHDAAGSQQSTGSMKDKIRQTIVEIRKEVEGEHWLSAEMRTDQLKTYIRAIRTGTNL